MNCPDCGARNPDSASWCSQCLRPLGRQAPPAADESPPAGPRTVDHEPRDVPAARTPPADGRDTAASGDDGLLEAGGGRFRRTDEGIDWACARCGTWNPIEVSRCTACGQPLGSGDDEEAASDVDPTAALVATVLLPGLGHVLAGRSGTGAARILVWLLFLVGGLGLVLAAADAEQTILPGAVLLLAAALVWAGSVADVRAVLAGGRREILDTRTLLWLVVGAIGGLTVAFLITAMGASG